MAMGVPVGRWDLLLLLLSLNNVEFYVLRAPYSVSVSPRART